MTTDEVAASVTRVMQAADYVALFGKPPDGEDVKAMVRKTYRNLARQLHPDNGAPDDAQEAFKRLAQLYDEAQDALTQGKYGQAVVLATVRSRRGSHQLHTVLSGGELCATYGGEATIGGIVTPAFYKIAKAPADRDLLDAEATALRRFRADGTNKRWHPFVPRLLDSFDYREAGKPARRCNVIQRLENFHSLEQVRRAYPAGVPPLNAVWMWRKLLVSLAHAHDNHVAHGAVLPQHVMIFVENDHGVVLTDWCYASIGDQDTHDQPAIKAIVQANRDWYPAEVLSKEPPSPATDLAMAARTLIYLMGGNPVTGVLPESQVPRPFRAFFKGCLAPSQQARPQNAWKLLAEFDELLKEMGRPYYPRRFLPFAVPTGMA